MLNVTRKGKRRRRTLKSWGVKELGRSNLPIDPKKPTLPINSFTTFEKGILWKIIEGMLKIPVIVICNVSQT